MTQPRHACTDPNALPAFPPPPPAADCLPSTAAPTFLLLSSCSPRPPPLPLQVGIKVFQGEREMAGDNNMLGQVGGGRAPGCTQQAAEQAAERACGQLGLGHGRLCAPCPCLAFWRPGAPSIPPHASSHTRPSHPTTPHFPPHTFPSSPPRCSSTWWASRPPPAACPRSRSPLTSTQTASSTSAPRTRWVALLAAGLLAAGPFPGLGALVWTRLLPAGWLGCCPAPLAGACSAWQAARSSWFLLPTCMRLSTPPPHALAHCITAPSPTPPPAVHRQAAVHHHPVQRRPQRAADSVHGGRRGAVCGQGRGAQGGDRGAERGRLHDLLWWGWGGVGGEGVGKVKAGVDPLQAQPASQCSASL